MKIGPKGIALIQEFEGCKLTSYFDSVGICTVGWGSTGSDVKPGMTITQSEADQRLRGYIAGMQERINALVTVPLTQTQFDALCSFTYNLGAGALHTSTLLKLINLGDFGGAAKQFLRWDKAGGVPLPGLTRRRHAEMALFEEK